MVVQLTYACTQTINICFVMLYLYVLLLLFFGISASVMHNGDT